MQVFLISKLKNFLIIEDLLIDDVSDPSNVCIYKYTSFMGYYVTVCTAGYIEYVDQMQYV